MLPQEIIARKRDGGRLPASEIDAFIKGLSAGEVSEGQAAAFAMAVFFQGMEHGECADLTRAMTNSGLVLDWRDLPGPALDKHSTGGIGDTVSLMLAPAVAACGGFVPMISGRGLGHTGGTLDKLDAIPGYRSQPDLALFRKTVRQAGAAIIGQTGDLAPADRRLYAIRDVTATVESIPLITASILSKKLAAGLNGLAMDVKFGSGAFMKDEEKARDLARSIVSVAAEAGLPSVALLTDMNEPLGSSAGNALEIAYTLDYLTGKTREARLHAVVLALGGEMLALGGLAGDARNGQAMIAAAIETGRAAERFGLMVSLMGGPHDLIERPDRHLAKAALQRPVYALGAGYVQAVDTRALGLAVVTLGGGRTHPQGVIDPAVGLSVLAGIGERIDAQRPLALVHAQDETAFAAAEAQIRAAYRLGDAPRTRAPLILDRIAGEKS